MSKRVLSFLLTLILFVSIFPVSHAETVQPRYSHVLSIGAGLDLNGDSLWLLGQGDSMFNDTYSYLYVTLLRIPEDGGNWSPVSSWSTSSVGVIPSLIEKTVTVVPGYNYKIYVNLQIKDETGYILESVGMYSHVEYYPSTSN